MTGMVGPTNPGRLYDSEAALSVQTSDVYFDAVLFDTFVITTRWHAALMRFSDRRSHFAFTTHVCTFELNSVLYLG